MVERTFENKRPSEAATQVETETDQRSKISVRKFLGLVLTSGLAFNFTQVKGSIFLNSAFKFKSRRFLRIYFFLCIKLQEKLMKIQCADISKSYLKLCHVPELSHSVHRGINPSTPSSLKSTLPIFCQAFSKLSKPLFRQFPIYSVFL